MGRHSWGEIDSNSCNDGWVEVSKDIHRIVVEYMRVKALHLHKWNFILINLKLFDGHETGNIWIWDYLSFGEIF